MMCIDAMTRQTHVRGRFRLMMSVLLFLITGQLIAQEPPQRTGEYTLSSTIIDIMGADQAEAFRDKVEIDTPVNWEVVVPADYDPSNPPGLLVFTNSRDSGRIEPEWIDLLARHGLIWVSANDAGNSQSIARRVAYAILAPRLISRDYVIDPTRIYISGFSGGGRVASLVATEYNDLFQGAIYQSGANFWGEAALARYRDMTDHRYVFITGTEDFNLEDTRQVHAEYLKAGLVNSELMVISGMGHKRPAAEIFSKAIEYLDRR